MTFHEWMNVTPATSVFTVCQLKPTRSALRMHQLHNSLRKRERKKEYINLIKNQHNLRGWATTGFIGFTNALFMSLVIVFVLYLMK